MFFMFFLGSRQLKVQFGIPGGRRNVRGRVLIVFIGQWRTFLNALTAKPVLYDLNVAGI